MKSLLMSLATLGVAMASSIPSQAIVLNFEDLAFASGNFENGANLVGSESIVNNPYGAGTGSLVTRTSTITSGTGPTASLTNVYSRKFSGVDGTGSQEFDFWSGWAYSKATDNVTSSFGNQYSSIAGSGAGGSINYLVGYQSFSALSLRFNTAVNFVGGGLSVTNTTYAFNDMRDGSSFSKKFGGGSGNDEDWFLLSIEGFASDVSQGTVEFYLADFRFADNSQDYLINDWTFVSLSALGTVDELRFSLTSTDNGMYGMNTPAYFALDSIIVVPEPTSVALIVLAGGFLCFRQMTNRRSQS